VNERKECDCNCNITFPYNIILAYQISERKYNSRNATLSIIFEAYFGDVSLADSCRQRSDVSSDQSNGKTGTMANVTRWRTLYSDRIGHNVSRQPASIPDVT